MVRKGGGSAEITLFHGKYKQDEPAEAMFCCHISHKEIPVKFLTGTEWWGKRTTWGKRQMIFTRFHENSPKFEIMAGVLRWCSGAKSNNSTISFLVVSNSELCEKISEALHSAAKQRKCPLVVHQCESVAQVVKPRTNLAVDFIIFAVDGQVTHSISEVEQNLNSIDSNYVISGSVCLVYCHNASGTLGITYHKARELSRKYYIKKFLNTNVQDPENCLLLAERLLNLVEGVLGLKTGFPNCIS